MGKLEQQVFILPENDVAGSPELLLPVHERGHVGPGIHLPLLLTLFGEGVVVPLGGLEHVVHVVIAERHDHLSASLEPV